MFDRFIFERSPIPQTTIVIAYWDYMLYKIIIGLDPIHSLGLKSDGTVGAGGGAGGPGQTGEHHYGHAWFPVSTNLLNNGLAYCADPPSAPNTQFYRLRSIFP